MSRVERATRRTVLRAAAGAVGVTGAAGCLQPSAAIPSGAPVAPEDVTHRVASARALEDALATPNATVWLPGDRELEIDDFATDFTLAPGVTLASDRGTDGSPGARLRIPAGIPAHPLVSIDGAGARVTGLRFEAPKTEPVATERHLHPTFPTTGLAVDADGVEIDHCLFRGWSHAGIEIGRGAFRAETHIHHCDFFDNPSPGLGYGVTTFRGAPVIERCRFNNNRHSVAADGHRRCAYVCRYNWFGPATTSHVIDMHRGSENSSRWGTQGGRYVQIYGNVVLATEDHEGDAQEAVRIRGPPLEGAWIQNNRFAHEELPNGLGGSGEAWWVTGRSAESVGLRASGNVADPSVEW